MESLILWFNSTASVSHITKTVAKYIEVLGHLTEAGDKDARAKLLKAMEALK